MKIDLKITDRRWQHQLHAKMADSGQFYCTLTDLEGKAIEHAPVCGFYESLTEIARDAVNIHARLLAMIEGRQVCAVPTNPQRPKYEPEVGAIAGDAHSGDPRYDDTHPDF